MESAVPSLEGSLVQEKESSFGVNRRRTTGFWRIRVMLQQHLPFGFSPLRLFRKRSGDFKKLLSCC